MRKITLSILISALCVVTLIAQENTEQTKKCKVIIKKITVENENGIETTKETFDTFDLSNMKDMHLEGFDWSSDEFKDLHIESLKDGEKKVRIVVRKDGEDASQNEDISVFSMDPEHQGIWEQAFKTSSPNKAVLGVQLENVEGSNGAQVIEVFEGSAAEKIGLQEGDIILSVSGKETRDVDAVIEALSKNKPGDKVKIKYLRETKVKSATAVLQERKEEAFSKVMCLPSKHCKVLCCKAGNSQKNCKEEKTMICKDGSGLKQLRAIRDGSSDGKDNVIIIRKEGKDGEIKNEIEGGSQNEQIKMRTNWEKQEGRSLNVEVLTSSPNPNNGQMKISFEGKKEPTTIELMDLNGKEIFKEKIDQFDGTYNKEIEIENAKGTLILKVTQGDKVLTQKIIVK